MLLKQGKSSLAGSLCSYIFAGFLLFCHSVLFAQLTISTVDDKTKNPNETSIALHPVKKGFLVGGSNVDNIYWSANGAKSWNHLRATSPLGIYGDPVLHYADTNLFFAHLSKTKGKKYGDWFDRIVVQQIHNLEPWQETSYSVGYNNDKMQDKPWLSSDYHSNYSGSVYVSWTEFDEYDSDDEEDRSRIRFSAYHPITDRFSDAITVSDTTGTCVDDDNTLEGATTAVGKNGEVYMAWSGFEKIYFDKSLDGGKTWGLDKIVAYQPEGWDMAMPNIFRANGMPFLACDTQSNMLFLVWADEKNGNGDVWLKTSANGGETWSQRIRINQDTTSSHQYFPNISYHQESETLYITWWDQRNSPRNLFYDIYVATYNLKQGIQEYRITPQSIPLPGKSFFYGDYIDIDVGHDCIGVIYPVYNERKRKSFIQAAYGKTEHLKSTKERIQPIVNLESTLTQSVVVVNASAPFMVKGQLITGNFFNKKRYRFKHKEIYLEQPADFEIARVEKSSNYRLKYKTRNLK
jgi:hypothetical protein